MYIETERMIIREFCQADVEDLQEILGDPEVMKDSEPAYTPERTKEFLASFCIEKQGAIAAVLKESGKLIGYILFHEIDPEIYEIGWFFNRSYWNNGYAYESCKAVMEHGFRQSEVHKIFAETIDGVKSVGLMEKLGMKREGIQRKQTRDLEGKWRDLYLYGLLQEDL